MSGNALYMSPQNAELENFTGDYTPDLDYLDADGYEFEDADFGGDMIGAVPGEHESGTAEGHEKRKNPDELESGEEGDSKRQEGEKGAKRPGRKPLTSEPTTKRKAQNRAAQRAFRERKERHVKDLETKVSELTKVSEADKTEKATLQARVDILHSELKEARKRLSLNGAASAFKGSPPLAAYTGQHRSNSGPTQGNFQFDFPKFGELSGSQMLDNNTASAASANNGVVTRGSVTPPVINQSPTAIGGSGRVSGSNSATLSRANSSSERNKSPKTTAPHGNGSRRGSPFQHALSMPAVDYSSPHTMPGFAGTLPQMGVENPFGDLFSPGLLHSASMDGNIILSNAQQATKHSRSSADTNHGGDSTAGLNRVFQFNSGSSAESASPSNSSFSQWNANGTNTSCGTSPESTHDSPANKPDSNGDSFYDKNAPHHNALASTPGLVTQQSNGSYDTGLMGNTFDYNLPSSNTTFDPVLFGDYRDHQFNSFGGGNGDFSNGFFDEALNYDFGSPSNLFGILQSPQQASAVPNLTSGQNAGSTPSRNLMAEVERTRDGGDDDYGLPMTQPKDGSSGKLISCNNIWNQLQSIPDFRSGSFDLDGLCSELRAKARCSESGVMVDQEHVEAAFKKMGKKDDKGRFIAASQPMTDMPPLMFEQDSWDNVLKKLGQSSNQY
ncbi:hypothetical protein LTR08_002077 [Meristemomyces frigidus]|nr:hypothetical protein LTR08_002077 [Meristemomyces frigidus]